MINVSNWEERKAHYEQYWNRTNKTPLLFICGEIENPVYDKSLSEVESETFWFDPNWHIKNIRDGVKNTYYGCDSYPYISPSIGPDIISGMLGLEIDYNETSAWVKHKDVELSEFSHFKLDKENFYYKKMEEMLTAYCKDAGDDYVVGMVDLNTLLDGVASLIGPENLCFEIMDNPDQVQRVIKEHFSMYKTVYNEYANIIHTKYNQGSTNWLALYSQTPWYFISNDFMVMISKADFDRFVLQPLTDVIKFHGRAFFHLDGENMVPHLDSLLKIKELTGVQVQATPLVHTASFWIENIQKIQAAGKNVIVAANDEEDLFNLLNNVSPVGLYVSLYLKKQSDVERVEARLAEFYKEKQWN